MSEESPTPEVAEIDPRITKITTAWKRVKKLEKELTDQQNCIDEMDKRLEEAIQEAEFAELEMVAGNDEFRKKYEHQREKIRRFRGKMKKTKEVFGAQKKKLTDERDKLEDIDRASKEEALPIIKASSPTSEAWRDVAMTHLTKISKNPLTETVVNKLIDAGYDTLGKLTDYKSSGSWYTDIDGIGKATSDKIDDAIEQFFAEWNTLATAPAAEESEAEEAKPVDLLAKPIAEIEGITPAIASALLEGEKIKTLKDLQDKLTEMGEDGPLWLDCTVGKQEAGLVRDSISKLMAA